MSTDLENMDTSLTVDDIIKGLEWYPPHVNFLSKQKRAMRRCMKKSGSLKLGCYEARLINLIGYLASFPGDTMDDKIGFTELNEIVLKSMPNSWTKTVYVQEERNPWS